MTSQPHSIGTFTSCHPLILQVDLRTPDTKEAYNAMQYRDNMPTFGRLYVQVEVLFAAISTSIWQRLMKETLPLF
jgi:hypothetical protein